MMPDEAKLLLQTCVDQHVQAVTQSNTAKPQWYPDHETESLESWQWLVDNGYFETIGAELTDGLKLTGKGLAWNRK